MISKHSWKTFKHNEGVMTCTLCGYWDVLERAPFGVCCFELHTLGNCFCRLRGVGGQGLMSDEFCILVRSRGNMCTFEKASTLDAPTRNKQMHLPWRSRSFNHATNIRCVVTTKPPYQTCIVIKERILRMRVAGVFKVTKGWA